MTQQIADVGQLINHDPIQSYLSGGDLAPYAAAKPSAVDRGEPGSTDISSAPDILRRAIDLQDARAIDYDQPGGERSMGKAVQAFNAIKGREVLVESDGWLLQALVKMVRDQSRQHAHRDSCEDLVSYSSLYAESRIGGR